MIAIVTGMIGTYPVGGVVWDYGQYALALEQLGFDVYYLEDTGQPTYDPQKMEYDEEPAFAVRFLESSLSQLSVALGKQWRFCSMNGEAFGIEDHHFRQIVEQADLFLNVSGGTLLRDEYMACQCKVLIDTDPGWNHFVNFPKWDANPGWLGTHGWRAHDHFFTYAERIGQPDCVLPDLGIEWKPTRPSVVIDRWRPQPPGNVWTTVTAWNNFRKPIEHDGKIYGTKELEFEKVKNLPSRVQANLEIAAGGHEPPFEEWRKLGWSAVDSYGVSQTLDDYREYVQKSRGEFSVSKNLYVATRSGWSSCRSVCYLAASRPVIVQDTGFSEFTPTGEGLFAFSTLDEAVAAVECIEANYAYHQKRAREIAGDIYDSRVVLTELLKEIGLV